MGVFLAAKQIVDILYKFKFLDVIMVGFAGILCVVKFISVIKNQKFNFKQNVNVLDVVILLLGILFVISVLKFPLAYTNGVKIESAFLLYFLGRLYGKEVLKYGRLIATVSYVVIYLDAFFFFYKLISYIVSDELFFDGISVIRNNGYLYNFKTDAAVAILFGTIFIYCFSKISTLKWFTILVFNPIFIFNTYARTCQAFYLVLLAFIIFLEIRKKIKRMNNENESKTEDRARLNKINSICNGVIIFAAAALIIAFFSISFTSISKNSFEEMNFSDNQKEVLETTFHSREVIWWDTFHYLSNSPIHVKLLGENLDDNSFASHNGANVKSHSIVTTLFYSVGILGATAFLVFVFGLFKIILLIENEYTKFIAISTIALFLFLGFTVDTLEYTQYSWFTFLFAGVAVTEFVKIKSKIEK